MSPAITGELIEMPFGDDSCGPKEPFVRWGQVWTNPFVAAMPTGDMAMIRPLLVTVLLCKMLCVCVTTVRTWQRTRVWIQQHVRRHWWNCPRVWIVRQRRGLSWTSGVCQLTRNWWKFVSFST